MKHADFGPLCPRCGYDQSGLMAIWRESDECPLRGRCAECGLDFQWVDVLRPGRGDLRWFYEHTPRGIGMLRALKTWTIVLWPPAFWRRVRLETRLSPWRLVSWPLVIFACLHAACIATNLILFGRSLFAGPMTSGRLTSYLVNSVIFPLATLRFDALGRPIIQVPLLYLPYVITGAAAFSTLVPIMLLLLGQSRTTAKVRVGHVLRAWIFQLAPLLVLFSWFVLQRAFEASFNLGPGSRGWMPTSSRLILAQPVIALVFAAWLMLYWCMALTRGFRLERGRLVWALLMVAGLLVSAIAALADPRFRQLVGGI